MYNLMLACVCVCVYVCVLLHSRRYHHEPSLLEKKVNIIFFQRPVCVPNYCPSVVCCLPLKTVQARQNVLPIMGAGAVSYQHWLLERKVLYM